MKLYFSPGVCSLVPHILLREAGLEFTLDKVDSANKRTAGGLDYFTINPHGYVPALETAAGQILTEGPAIMQYIADLQPAAKLAPPAGSFARYQLQEWLNFITSEIHKGFAPLFSKTNPAEVKAAARDLLGKRFDYVESVLQQRETLMEGGYSAADAYLFVTSGWSSFVDVDLQKWPALVAFRQRIEARPAVRAAMVAEGLIK